MSASREAFDLVTPSIASERARHPTTLPSDRPRPQDEPSMRELRLALVCYGGVSLAIYMHGITKEIHRLVVASRGLELSPEENPFASGTERIYWEALRAMRERDGVQTRVVVDILAGSSAGGINAVFLAKALAHNLSQDALRDTWMERGDLRQLISVPLPGLTLKALGWFAYSLLRRRFRPPLDGDRMLDWLHQALERMDARKDPVAFPEERSLTPEDHLLSLFVTTTDLSGYLRLAPAHAPKQVPDLWHQHVLKFVSGDGRDQLDAPHNPALALAARATSCFPGAFPPVDVATVGRVLRPPGWPGDFPGEFARIYGLSGTDVGRAFFIDGGVLDNRPFQVAIEAIMEKPAATEVDRRLVYIEPDPYVAPPSGSARDSRDDSGNPTPSMVSTIWAGLSTIPRAEPILSDLLTVRRYNASVREIADIVNTAYGSIERAVDEYPVPPAGDWAEYEETNRKISDEAAATSGAAHVPYVRLKLHSVLTGVTRLVSRLCRFPQDANHFWFVREVLYRWANERGILEPSESPTDAQLEFLKAFDLDYRERRIRFVIKGMNQLYGKVDERDTRPTRSDLDRAKARLWSFIVRLRGIVRTIASGDGDGGPVGDIRRTVREIFDERAIAEILGSYSRTDIDEAVEAFAARAMADLDRVSEMFRAYLEEELAGFSSDLYVAFQESTAGWGPKVRDRLLVRYLGFPYWDILIYPIQHVSDIRELNRVEVIRMSPSDVRLLRPHGAKAKLKGVSRGHFGAFFERSYRENDYLWGRLDAAERLLWLLFDTETGDNGSAAQEGAVRRYGPPALRAILEEERPGLTSIKPLFDEIESQLRGEE